ncbi:ABC transporter permease [Streptomyces sp. NPDC002896]|uniref:ABC transporter permease n=1 Tax=Streptomyces sp. NPDC002896 TaxID=3154438 RepID=UPI003321E350
MSSTVPTQSVTDPSVPARPAPQPSARLAAPGRRGPAEPQSRAAQARLALGPLWVLAVAAAALLCCFLLLPFAVLLTTSWTGGEFLTFPPQGFSLRWYQALFADTMWTSSFWMSIGVASVATLVATALGASAALAMARLRSARWSRPLRTLFVLPMAIPLVAYALGLYDVVLRLPALQTSLAPLVLGEAVIAFPVVFVLLSGALARVDPALRSAAQTMGARWPTVVWRVELPLLRGTLAAGALFAFNSAFDEVVLSVFLIPPGQTATFPLQMLNASREAISPMLTAASTLVSFVALAVLGGAGLLNRRKESRPS